MNPFMSPSILALALDDRQRSEHGHHYIRWNNLLMVYMHDLPASIARSFHASVPYNVMHSHEVRGRTPQAQTSGASKHVLANRFEARP